MQLFVIAPGGRILTLQLSPNDDIALLKRLVAQKLGDERLADRLKLWKRFTGKQLDKGALTLAEYGIQALCDLECRFDA